MDLLCGNELSLDERSYLARLSLDPGYAILKRLMADACRQATEDVIKLDPTVDEYAEKLKSLQQIARAMNQFSANLIKSIDAYANSVLHANEPEEEEQTNPLLKRVAVKFPIREDLKELLGK